MELVPILSTIILVGTIATFILAVAAYILYKIREGKARESHQQTGYMQQEPHVLVAPDRGQQPMIQQIQQTAPAPASMYQPAPGQPVQRQQLQAPQQGQGQNPNSLFWEYTDEGFVPVNPQQEQVQQQQQQAPQPPQQAQQDEGYAWL